jgi:hypothetical protein
MGLEDAIAEAKKYQSGEAHCFIKNQIEFTLLLAILEKLENLENK